jgi:pseudouridine synthase
MRLNKFIADNTSLSRRAADKAIELGKVTINGQNAVLGANITETDTIALDGVDIKPKNSQKIVVLLNKPVGYVCSKDGQGSPTIYDILQSNYKDLNIAGRLDKDSSGLVLLTNDGDLLYKLTHPSQSKVKVYKVALDKALINIDVKNIERGVQLQDGPSKLMLTKLDDEGQQWKVEMHEGRNRQIRRTFMALGYNVKKLHRTKIDQYEIGDIKIGKFMVLYI